MYCLDVVGDLFSIDKVLIFSGFKCKCIHSCGNMSNYNSCPTCGSKRGNVYKDVKSYSIIGFGDKLDNLGLYLKNGKIGIYHKGELYIFECRSRYESLFQ